MTKLKTLKNWQWHIIAVVIFLLVSMIYFAPAVFQDKEMVQGDVTSVVGWQKELNDYHEQTGEYAFWSNNMFSGMPANGIKYPPSFNVFKYLADIFSLYITRAHIGIVLLYLIGFYVLLCSLKCKPWMAIIGAIAYGLASYNIIIIEAGHINKGLAMALMAPVIGGVVLLYRKKYWQGMLITLIATGIHIYFSHQQITYYLLIILLCVAVAYLVQAIRNAALKDYFKSSVLALAMALLALLPALGQWLPTYDYSTETMRGGTVLQHGADKDAEDKSTSGLDRDYAFQWSYGKMESFTLLIPDFYGGSSHYDIGEDSELYKATRNKNAAHFAPTYWGDQPFTSGPTYVGAIICMLFVMGCILVKGPEKWWLIAATVLSLLLSWGRNLAWFNDFLFYHLPMYNKFRTPAMALTIAEVSMVTLGILGLKEFFEQKNQKTASDTLKKALFLSVGITAGLCLFFALVGPSLFKFTSVQDARYGKDITDILIADRKALLVSDSFRSLIFILLAGFLLWAWLKDKLKTGVLALGLGILVTVDLWGVDKRMVNAEDFVDKKRARAILPTQADLQILQDTDPNFRVFNLSTNTFNETNTAYFHKSIGGYSPAKLRRYQDIIDFHLSAPMNIKVLNMLNAKYIIVPQGNQPQAQLNPDALGNSWFVNRLHWVKNPDEEIRALYDFEPATTAVIEELPEWKNILKDYPDTVVQSSDAYVRLMEYQPGYLRYESSNSRNQVAVFSEVFYPKTWKAYVDGVEAPHFRANYILRAMLLPEGKHSIEFKCQDPLYPIARNISLWSSVLVILVLLALCFRGYQEFRKNNHPQPEKES